MRFETCGLPIALSLACKVPVLVPFCVAVNTTLIVQEEVAPKVEVQVVLAALTLKSPVVEILIPVKGTF